ncbi:hypothetical protein CK226_21905 [Mesorhizobium sp. WSM4311]|nr:hypothetical protein CK226_21905 [Mesorhizobium sp. WSM4311]
MRAQADLSDKVVADKIDSAILMETHPAVPATDFVLAASDQKMILSQSLWPTMPGAGRLSLGARLGSCRAGAEPDLVRPGALCRLR